MYKGHADSCYCRKQKVTPDPGPVFYKFLTPAPSPKEKRKIQLELTPAIWIRGHLWSVRPGSKKHLYDWLRGICKFRYDWCWTYKFECDWRRNTCCLTWLKKRERQERMCLVSQPGCSTFCARVSAKRGKSTTRANFASKLQCVIGKLFQTFGGKQILETIVQHTNNVLIFLRQNMQSTKQLSITQTFLNCRVSSMRTIWHQGKFFTLSLVPLLAEQRRVRE